MAHLILTPNLTRDVLDQQIRATHRGQAHFAHGGPFAATCGECVYLGYFRQHYNRAGDPIKATHTGGCAKFLALTGRHGAVVPPHASACKYFQRKGE
jgi:hypothetical protein